MAKQNSTKEENTGWERREIKALFHPVKCQVTANRKMTAAARTGLSLGLKCPVLACPCSSPVTYSATPPMGWHLNLLAPFPLRPLASYL